MPTSIAMSDKEGKEFLLEEVHGQTHRQAAKEMSTFVVWIKA